MGYTGSDAHWSTMTTSERFLYVRSLGLHELAKELEDLKFDDDKLQKKLDRLVSRTDSAIRWAQGCAYDETYERRLKSKRVTNLKTDILFFILSNRTKSRFYDIHDEGHITRWNPDHELSLEM